MPQNQAQDQSNAAQAAKPADEPAPSMTAPAARPVGTAAIPTIISEYTSPGDVTVNDDETLYSLLTERIDRTGMLMCGTDVVHRVGQVEYGLSQRRVPGQFAGRAHQRRQLGGGANRSRQVRGI